MLNRSPLAVAAGALLAAGADEHDRRSQACWQAGYAPVVATIAGVQRRTYPATFALFAWLAFGWWAIMFGVILLVVHPKHGASEALITQVLIGATIFTGFLVFFFLMARCRVSATRSALIVVHPIRRYVFPWPQVADVVVGRGGALLVVVGDGRCWRCGSRLSLSVSGWLLAPHRVLV
jgi:hypothetical protein